MAGFPRNYGRFDGPVALSEAARNVARLVAVVLVTLVLAGCADDAEDRRFANEPIPTEDLVAQPTLPPSVIADRQPTVAATPLTTEQLLQSAGTATHLWWRSGDSLLAVDIAGGEPVRVAELPTAGVLDWKTTPTGDRAAVLIATDGAILARVIGLDGATVLEAKLASFASGTPVPAGAGHYHVAWSAAGDRLLVSLATGGILDVAADGAVRTLLNPSQARSPRSVAWSPSGEAIAYVDAGDTGSGTGLYVASVESLPVDPVMLIRPIPGSSRQIDDIAWTAGSSGIVYSLRAADANVSLGGDVFAISVTGGTPRLIGSAAATTQGGSVGAFAVSADGRAIAYAVEAPSDAGVEYLGLVVRQIDGEASAEVTGTAGAQITGVTWTAAGPAWVAWPLGPDQEPITVARAGSDGAVSVIFQVAPPAPPATPVASPVGSPVASPRATPEAAPEG